MVRLQRLLAVAVLAQLCGCNAVLGLEDSTLAPDGSVDVGQDSIGADAGTDVTVDVTADTNEDETPVFTPDDARPDTKVADAAADTRADAVQSDGAADTRVDAADTGPKVDTGCALDDPTSCGTCGRACSTTNTDTLSCAAGQCFPTCQPGFTSCTQPPAPAADDGCECEGSVCCGASCATKHSNGIGNSYYDCVAVGTIDLTQATAAADSWPETTTPSSGACGKGANQSLCISRATASSCAVWCYSNSLAGRVRLNAASAQCACPTTSDPTWD